MKRLVLLVAIVLQVGCSEEKKGPGGGSSSSARPTSHGIPTGEGPSDPQGTNLGGVKK